MSWKRHVPKEKRDAFKEAFIQQVVVKELDYLMDNAFYYGNSHHYDDFHKGKNEEACDDCLDDSDDRDTRDHAERFFTGLWKEVCAQVGVETQKKKQKVEEEEEEEEEE